MPKCSLFFDPRNHFLHVLSLVSEKPNLLVLAAVRLSPSSSQSPAESFGEQLMALLAKPTNGYHRGVETYPLGYIWSV
jgi:hypothetical protein